MSERIGGSQPRLDRRKMIPNPIRMYAEIADLDFITALPLNLHPVRNNAPLGSGSQRPEFLTG